MVGTLVIGVVILLFIGAYALTVGPDRAFDEVAPTLLTIGAGVLVGVLAFVNAVCRTPATIWAKQRRRLRDLEGEDTQLADALLAAKAAIQEIETYCVGESTREDSPFDMAGEMVERGLYQRLVWILAEPAREEFLLSLRTHGVDRHMTNTGVTFNVAPNKHAYQSVMRHSAGWIRQKRSALSLADAEPSFIASQVNPRPQPTPRTPDSPT